MAFGKNISIDDVLIARLKEGNREAFEELYNRYWERLFIMAANRLGSREAAWEIVQDLFVDLWQRRESLSVKSSFSAYIHTSLKYSILDFIRSQKVKEKYIEAIRKTASAQTNSTFEHITFNELNEAIQKEIANLPERCRLAFRMHRFENYSSREIASKLNISTRTVEHQIGKALKVLRSNLKEYLTMGIGLALTIIRIYW